MNLLEAQHVLLVTVHIGPGVPHQLAGLPGLVGPPQGMKPVIWICLHFKRLKRLNKRPNTAMVRQRIGKRFAWLCVKQHALAGAWFKFFRHEAQRLLNHRVVWVSKTKRAQVAVVVLMQVFQWGQFSAFAGQVLRKHRKQFCLLIKVGAGRHQQADPVLLWTVAAVMKPEAGGRLPQPAAGLTAVKHL